MTKPINSNSRPDQSSSKSSPSTELLWVDLLDSELSPPSLPGVYWFSDADDKVLYVGKAKNLKNRTRQYTQLNRLSNRIKQMVKIAAKLQYKVLGSELEALLIEAELIRTHQPDFNVLLKDDKSSLYIHLTPEKFPRVTTLRKKELHKLNKKGTIIGPLPSAYKVREVLKLIRPIFRWCNKRGDLPIQDRPCFYYQIELCSGACVGQVEKENYQQNIKNLSKLLKGKTKFVTTNLNKELKQAAATQEYEQAAIIRDQLAMIEEVTQSGTKLQPDLTLPNLYQIERQDALIQLAAMLHEYGLTPKGWDLSRIEGYDVSNIQGTNPTVAMVVFINGQSDTSEYKLFNIRTLNTPNDYGMMQEAIVRRQNHPEWDWPGLIVIDGGKGQLRAAQNIWQQHIPIISIAKNPDRIIIPKLEKVTPQAKTGNQKKVVVFDTEIEPMQKITGYHILKLPENHPVLKLIQNVRDESHRFSKKQHTRMRTKHMFQ